MNDKLIIFDTTLRDGAQTPGIGMNVQEKLRIALQLERLGVDIMEVGFPASSPAEFEAVSAISKRIVGSHVAVLARAVERDINRAWEAVKHAQHPVLQTFVSSSDIHMTHKLNMSREQVLDRVVAATRHARSLAEYVQFGFEDGSRTDPDFLCTLCEAAIDSGARAVNIADTVGFAVPEEFGQLIRYVIANTPNISKAIVGVHCHDDLGFANANTLAAVRAGARQVDVTINGIGERAGNTALEEVLAALHTKPQYFKMSTNIALDQIYPTSRLVSMLTGVRVQPNKAVVGDNAFSHESGIHQDGVLKSPLTYEIMTPEEFGVQGSKLVLGKQSGRHGLQARLEEMGYHLSDEELSRVFVKFKDLADQKRSVGDDDLRAILAECTFEGVGGLKFLALHTRAVEDDRFTATIEMMDGEEMKASAAQAGSPIQAAFEAIEKLADSSAEFVDFSVNALTDGVHARGEAIVRLKRQGRMILGRGIDPDIIAACAKAYIDGLNRLEHLTNHPVLRTGEKWDVRKTPVSA